MFCRYCGNQVLDEAYMCPSCGNMLKELPAPIVEPICVEEKPQPKRDKYKVPAMVLSIVATVLSGIQLALVGLTMGTLGFAIWGSKTTGGDWAALGWFGVIWYVYAVYALIGISPFSTATGIIGFCFGRKTEKKKIRKLAVVAFVLAMATVVCASVVYIFLFVGNA